MVDPPRLPSPCGEGLGREVMAMQRRLSRPPPPTPAHKGEGSMTLPPEYGCRRARSTMREDVFCRPTGQIEANPVWQEPKTGRREFLPALPCEQ